MTAPFVLDGGVPLREAQEKAPKVCPGCGHPFHPADKCREALEDHSRCVCNQNMAVEFSPPLREASKAFATAAQRLPSLFDLEDQAYSLLALLEEVTEGDDELELQSQLALIDQLLIEKTESYVSVIRSLEAMSEARKAESDRLKARSQTAAKHAEWLRQRLLAHMQTTGRERVETSRFTLSIRQNPEKCTVLEEMLVPQEFKRTVITTTVDLNAIKAHLKTTGEIVPGVVISRSQRLQIS